MEAMSVVAYVLFVWDAYARRGAVRAANGGALPDMIEQSHASTRFTELKRNQNSQYSTPEIPVAAVSQPVFIPGDESSATPEHAPQPAPERPSGRTRFGYFKQARPVGEGFEQMAHAPPARHLHPMHQHENVLFVITPDVSGAVPSAALWSGAPSTEFQEEKPVAKLAGKVERLCSSVDSPKISHRGLRSMLARAWDSVREDDSTGFK